MLLDRIDIDAHGPLSTVELGPFSEHLNVVLSPEGSGKTAIVRFIRDSLVDRDYPLGMMSSSSGRIVWADRNGMVHCRREKDGTSRGRRTIEVESRGRTGGFPGASCDNPLGRRSAALGDSVCGRGESDRHWIEQHTESGHFEKAARRGIELPESIVDGVITDTAVTSVGRVVLACVSSGLDHPDTYRDLPLVTPGDRRWAFLDEDLADRKLHSQASVLRQELASIETELSQVADVKSRSTASITAEKRALLQRREILIARLNQPREFWPWTTDQAADWPADTTQVHRQLASLHQQTRQLRNRRSELVRWIENIDHQIAAYPSVAGTAAFADDLVGGLYHDESLRRQIEELDALMIRWRHALLELRGLREAIAVSRDALTPARYASMDHRDLHRAGYHGFLDAADHYDVRYPWDAAAWYRRDDRPLFHVDQLHARFQSAITHLDELINRHQSLGDHAAVSQRTWPHLDAFASPANLAKNLVGTSPVAERTVCQWLGLIRHELETMAAVVPGAARNNDPIAAQVLRNGQSGEHWFLTLQQQHDQLLSSEQWLSASIQNMGRQRETLLRQHMSDKQLRKADASYRTSETLAALRAERNDRAGELQSVSVHLDNSLGRAYRLRRSLRSLPVIDSHGAFGQGFVDDSAFPAAELPGYFSNPEKLYSDPAAMSAEVRRIDARVGLLSHIESRFSRRDAVRAELEAAGRPLGFHSPLARLASTWLVRLTGGRLTRVQWDRDVHQVTIDSRDGGCRQEKQCSGADRAIATIAVRMAAGELLHRLGRVVPLVLETHRELIHQTRPIVHDAVDHGGEGFTQSGDLGRINAPIAAALRDYAVDGRQVLVLTSDDQLSRQLGRVGARQYQIFVETDRQSHRPIWRPQYARETYVGPRPHIYGNTSVRQTDQINRDFDVAWREAYGIYDSEASALGSNSVASTDRAPGGSLFRDGYYVGNTSTTRRPHDGPDRVVTAVAPANETLAAARLATGRPATGTLPTGTLPSGKPASPFFLSVDSPIDQAPSIDAVAAARLRGLAITHVTHLMQHDSNRLADSLGLADVDARAIRRWQAECRLACRVPHLRGFDARVLVGCGIYTPSELAAIHPVDLLRRVESFLATRRGQQLLLSGSSHELSRLTTWIAAANTNQADDSFDRDRYETERSLRSSGRRRSRRSAQTRRYGIRSAAQDDLLGEDELPDPYEADRVVDGYVSSRRASSKRRRPTSHSGRSTASRGDGSGSGRASSAVGTRSSSRRSTGGQRSRRSANREGYESTSRRSGTSHRSGTGRSQRSGQQRDGYGQRETYERETSRRDLSRRDSSRRDSSRRDSSSRDSSRREASTDLGSGSVSGELRFYLQRDSPVVDAPSIGSRMASRLEAIGVYTVSDLLQGDAESIARELDHRRVDTETVLEWQQQATLVCCVPMLRGHDAQLLVAAEITAASQLAAQQPGSLFERIDPIASSSEGKRIIRGGKQPDLEEITQWIAYSQHHRSLQAA